MNRVILIGRLTKEPKITYATNGDNKTCVARYTLAVERAYKKEGSDSADFINCVAFGKNGEFAQKYLDKGVKICVEGRIQTGSYEDKSGTKRYTTDIVVERHEFCEKKANTSQNEPQSSPQNDGFETIDNMDNTNMPFNY